MMTTSLFLEDSSSFRISHRESSSVWWLAFYPRPCSTDKNPQEKSDFHKFEVETAKAVLCFRLQSTTNRVFSRLRFLDFRPPSSRRSHQLNSIQTWSWFFRNLRFLFSIKPRSSSFKWAFPQPLPVDGADIIWLHFFGKWFGWSK